jgi:hypothetical protein
VLKVKLRGVAAEEIAAEEIAGQALFEMANLRPERTGLPFVVFISQRGGARHDVRVKLAPRCKGAPVGHDYSRSTSDPADYTR